MGGGTAWPKGAEADDTEVSLCAIGTPLPYPLARTSASRRAHRSRDSEAQLLVFPHPENTERRVFLGPWTSLRTSPKYVPVTVRSNARAKRGTLLQRIANSPVASGNEGHCYSANNRVFADRSRQAAWPATERKPQWLAKRQPSLFASNPSEGRASENRELRLLEGLRPPPRARG